MKFGLKEEIIEGLKNVLQEDPAVTRALIFGSRACGDYKCNSDIDLAVYSTERLPAGLWLDLDEAAGIYKIDVIEMNSPLDEKFRLRIEEQGIEIYRKE